MQLHQSFHVIWHVPSRALFVSLLHRWRRTAFTCALIDKVHPEEKVIARFPFEAVIAVIAAPKWHGSIVGAVADASALKQSVILFVLGLIVLLPAMPFAQSVNGLIGGIVHSVQAGGPHGQDASVVG